MKPKNIFIIAVAYIIAASVAVSAAYANNLNVYNVSDYSIDSTEDTMTITLDVSWDNSWRDETNHDAIWLFIKYSTDSGVNWSHGTLSASGTNPTGFNAPSGFEIIVPEDEVGCLLQRSVIGSGTATATGARIVWDYGEDGVTDAQSTAVATLIKLFGIEMVYIPQGAFFAGGSTANLTAEFLEGSADTDPWYIDDEDAIRTDAAGSTDGYYYTSAGNTDEDASATQFLIPASFPKGYQAFYLMKYELTEGQWVDFFNTLPFDSSNSSKDNRDITSTAEGGKGDDGCTQRRNTVDWDADETQRAMTHRPDRAMSWVSWPDVCAYADWAGLRPMTELEFEKAARGADIAVLDDEFAWGTSSGSSAGNDEIDPNEDEDGDETISDADANIGITGGAAYITGDSRAGVGLCEGDPGPLRVGIFAESGSDRDSSGAGYYGNMELSGNVCEAVVTVGNTEGRVFLGTHGDGELSSTGYATNADWPGYSSGNVSGTVGSGCRGGDYLDSTTVAYHHRISDRSEAARNRDSEGEAQRHDASYWLFLGGRFARTAP